MRVFYFTGTSCPKPVADCMISQIHILLILPLLLLLRALFYASLNPLPNGSSTGSREEKKPGVIGGPFSFAAVVATYVKSDNIGANDRRVRAVSRFGDFHRTTQNRTGLLNLFSNCIPDRTIIDSLQIFRTPSPCKRLVYNCVLNCACACACFEPSK